MYGYIALQAGFSLGSSTKRATIVSLMSNTPQDKLTLDSRLQSPATYCISQL